MRGYNVKGKTLIVIDVDGTLSDNGHRFDLLPCGEDVHNADKWLLGRTLALAAKRPAILGGAARA